MIKRALLYIFLSYSCISQGQLTLVNNVDVKEYPTIYLSVNHPDFEYDQGFSAFQILNGSEVLCNIKTSIEADIDGELAPKNECVLILFEYSYHEDKEEQINTFLQALNKALPEIVNNGDEYKIYLFSLNEGGSKILTEVNSEFTDNIHDLTINRFPRKSDTNNKQTTNILEALNAGIELLSAHPSNLPKSILLLSEERQNSYSNNLSPSEVSKNAIDKNIRLDLIKYNRAIIYNTHSKT